jgi:hypothetical protein
MQMTFYIHARDAAGYITLRRETREAAAKKAEELEQMGYFEVEIIEESEAPDRRQVFPTDVDRRKLGSFEKEAPSTQQLYQ